MACLLFNAFTVLPNLAGVVALWGLPLGGNTCILNAQL
jgi:hypothetical protein